MPEVRSGGARIRYEDVGGGEPTLLFMPGWCGSRAVFEPLLRRCGARHRVIAVDLRGHGQSEQGGEDFTTQTLVKDLLAVIASSGARNIVPVALSHAGWLALELRRQLGARVRGLVLVDWLVLEPPPPFLQALKGLQSSEWQGSRDALFSMWLQGVGSDEVIRYVREDMGSYRGDMWGRAAREIGGAYEREGYPLRALTTLTPPVPTLHLYAQPEDPGYLMAQQSFASDHPWFQAAKLDAHSHFPLLEVPDQVAEHLERFLAPLERGAGQGAEAAP
jgi:pimeloyl-ACP methyl ester carboxylesterase